MCPVPVQNLNTVRQRNKQLPSKDQWLKLKPSCATKIHGHTNAHALQIIRRWRHRKAVPVLSMYHHRRIQRSNNTRRISS